MSEIAVEQPSGTGADVSPVESQGIDLGSIQDEGQISNVLRSATSEVDVDQLRNLLRGQPAVEPKQTEQEAEPAKDEPADEKQEESEEAPEPSDEHKPRPRHRRYSIGHLSDAQRRVFDLSSIKGISIHEAQEEAVKELVDAGYSERQATQEIYGKQPERESARREEAKPDPQEKQAGKVDAAQKKLDAAKEALKQAQKAYDPDAIEAARDQIDDARWELRDAKDEETRTQAREQRREQDAYQAAVRRSSDAIEAVYPDAFVEGSKLFDAVNARLDRIQERDPGFLFRDPDWPEFIVSAEAARLGIAPAKAVGATPLSKEAPKAKPIPKREVVKLQPTTGASSDGQPETKLESEADVSAYVAQAGNDPEKLKAILRQHGSRSF